MDAWVIFHPRGTAKVKISVRNSSASTENLRQATVAESPAANVTVVSWTPPEPTRAKRFFWTRDLPTKHDSAKKALEENQVTRNFTDPNEVHLHLGAEETMNCVKNTSISVMPNARLKLNRFYSELAAPKGFIERKFKLTEEQIRRMRRTFPDSLGCDQHTDRFCCALRVRVPAGFYAAVEVVVNVRGSFVNLYDPSNKRRIRVTSWSVNATEDKTAETALFVASANVVDVLHLVTLLGRRADGRFLLRFQAIADPGLQVRLTGFNQGVVQTPLHQLGTLLMTPLFNQKAHIEVPPGHVIMVSSPTLEVMRQCVTLYAGDRAHEPAQTRILFHGCYVFHAHVAVYRTSLLQVHLHDYEYYLYPCHDAGFQLNFSFHDESAAPVKLADSSWNCSVPYRPVLLHHLSCNMEVQCQDAADEEGCPYVTDVCGPGYLTLGGACLFYVRRPGVEISEKTGADQCRARRGRLAVINTVDKWTDTLNVLYLSGLSSIPVFVGITSSSFTLPLWYRTMYRWVDGTTAFYLSPYNNRKEETCRRLCGFINKHERTLKLLLLLDNYCDKQQAANILCEKPRFLQGASHKAIQMNGTEIWLQNSEYLACPLGHYTHTFLACDVSSSCWSRDHTSACESSLTPLPPSFACTNEIERVPYTLVCDFRVDCADGSDEDFCVFPPCVGEQYSCGNRQCISSAKTCDGWKDCHNGGDEEQCIPRTWTLDTIPPPARVDLSGSGQLVVRPPRISAFTGPDTCPQTHFVCPDGSYYLPRTLRCNGVYDCPGREDEAGCDTCPGFYRCRASTVCLHDNDLCDGHAHCPQHDDEVMCATACPAACRCRGQAFFCQRGFFAASLNPRLRFLHASGTDVVPAHLHGNPMLIHLSLAKCGLKHLRGLFLPNLLSLDVRDNRLRFVHDAHMIGLPQLRILSLAGNPLAFAGAGAGYRLPASRLQELDLSRIALPALNLTLFSAFPEVRALNLSSCGVQRVQGEGFRVMERLRVIDLRGCPMTWSPHGLFRNLTQLRAVYASSFRVCCPAVLPSHFNVLNCIAPVGDVSSCDDLLRGIVYKVCVFVLSFLAVAGNGISFVFRTRFAKREARLGYGTFVTHLSVSDFLMGVYLAIIGVADQVYHGTYLLNDMAWKSGVTCRFAGFLSLLSSEVSALIMCLITVDRFLVLRFPFSRLRFSSASAHVASAVVWLVVVILVSIPLLPVTSHWEFYSQTGICIPLPITTTDFPGRRYSFGILIVFNFIVFVVISMGQMCIYWSVRANAMSVSNTTKKSKDLTIARRLITVAMTDFLCWFPIGVLGLMASEGVSVPGELNVAMAIFVLPLNSAVNPCLYTVNVIVERNRLAREEKLRAFLTAQMKTCS